MRKPIVIVIGDSPSAATTAGVTDFGWGVCFDDLEDRVPHDFGTRGIFMDRSGSMDTHMLISLGDEISRMNREDMARIKIHAEDIKAPLGKSPDKIRQRQKDWQVGSGRGLRR